jgi:hypothetical protein
MAKTKPGYRVVIQLDPRVALEAILMNRLERLPLSRRQEWLRGLLVQGFRAECQALRGAPDNTTRCPPTGFKNWQAGEVQKPSTAETTQIDVQTRIVAASTTSKPFAALGKVIG